MMLGIAQSPPHPPPGIARETWIRALEESEHTAAFAFVEPEAHLALVRNIAERMMRRKPRRKSG